jgi:hypothetical protein
MLTGFNHNLRHRNLMFHVQTEDNGFKNPVVITTIFFQGNVVAMRRTSYAKFARLDEREEIVGAIMKEQHKEMMKDLVNDRFRTVQLIIEQKTGVAVKPKPIDVETPPRELPHPPAATRTLDADAGADRTLDELILDFLNEETQKPK